MTIGICLAMVMYTFLPVTRVAAEESTVNVRFDSNNISGNVVTFTVDKDSIAFDIAFTGTNMHCKKIPMNMESVKMDLDGLR